jgi:hypothetical protein
LLLLRPLIVPLVLMVLMYEPILLLLLKASWGCQLLHEQA